jgi:ribonuclease Z
LKRNVSALALVREAEWLLFDCGEGAQTQIARAGLSPMKLTAVLITHLHGDHLNGLPGLLSTMGLDRRTRELQLVGPPGIRDYLDTLTRLKTLFVTYPLHVCETSANEKTDVVIDRLDYVVRTRPLAHRVFALGYRVDEKPRPGRFDVDGARRLGVPEGPLFGELQSGSPVTLDDGRVVDPGEVLGDPRPGKSFAYCLDTRPCESAIALASGVDFLVHEATYTEELKAEAFEYGHSTAADAARTAREAAVGRLMLTHYSTRFTDPTVLLEEARSVFPETVLAEELVPVEL